MCGCVVGVTWVGVVVGWVWGVEFLFAAGLAWCWCWVVVLVVWRVLLCVGWVGWLVGVVVDCLIVHCVTSFCLPVLLCVGWVVFLGACFGLSAWFCVESLILAQDERWRRA